MGMSTTKTMTQCRVTAPAQRQYEAPDSSRWFETDMDTGQSQAFTMVWVPTQSAVMGRTVTITRPDTKAAEKWHIVRVYGMAVPARDIVSQIAK